MRQAMLALLLTLTATSAWGQFPLHLDLAGEWKISDRDDPSFGGREVDDRGWKPYSLPRRELPPIGTFWVRRTVRIPESTDTSQLALTIGPVIEVYDVFVNGKRIGARGEQRISQSFIVRPKVFGVPAGLVRAGETASIALKLWRPRYLLGAQRDPGAVPDDGPYLLTYRSNVPPGVEFLGLRERERISVSLFAIAGFQFAILTILLAVWLTDRHRSELLWMIGFVVTTGAWRLAHYVWFAMDWSHKLGTYAGPASTVAAICMVALAAELAGYRQRWIRIAVWVPLPVHVALNAREWVVDHGFDNPGWALPYRIALTSVILLGLSILVWKWRSGSWNRTTKALALSIGLMLSQSFPAFTSSRPFSVRWFAYGFNLTSMDAASLALTLIIAGLLLQRFLQDRRENARVAGELEAARMVQESLLSGTPATRAASCFAVDAAYFPANEVGGDFYQQLPADDEAVLVLVGDVSGKGLKAALLVGHVSGALSTLGSRQPGEVLARLNESLIGRSSGGFVTCCCARFDVDGWVTIANAGHPSPYLHEREVEVESGLPLGVVRGVEYAETRVRLGEGSQMTLVSDGVVEAADSTGELFGFERTGAVSGKSASAIAEAARAWGQTDDITVVTVRRAG